jgi:TM2 domain-containing membrane protein YozV
MNQSAEELQPKIRNKEPWLAVAFSAIVPGYGQIYAGKIVRGCVIIAISCLLFAIGILAILNPNNLLWGALCLAVGLISLQN